jgi:hypothetical protein
MLTRKVKNYIRNHQLCPEYLFDDWAKFLELLYEEGGCVESILWFEYVRIVDQKDSLGSGGYRDKINPEYMYAETFLNEDNMESKTLSEVKKQIESTLISYPKNKLFPAFHIAE